MEEQKKEDCAHCIFTTEKHTIEVSCNIGDIADCKNCDKFEHYQWMKEEWFV